MQDTKNKRKVRKTLKDENLEAIILAYPASEGEIKEGDLVRINTDYDQSSTAIVDHINPRFRRMDHQEDNPFKYFIKCSNGEVANYSEDELVKCNIAFFDYLKWKRDGSMSFLGHISSQDIKHIMAKKLTELDMGWSEIDMLSMKDLDGMIFSGRMQKKQIVENVGDSFPLMSVIHYFKVSK